jgi:chromosome segregation ATPase
VTGDDVRTNDPNQNLQTPKEETMKNSREPLKAAQAEAQKITAQVAQLEDALNRAKTMAEDAEESLEGFKDLDGTISRFRADAVKRGADPRTLPRELKEQAAQKKAAEEELEQANDTRELLATELAEAKEQQSRLQASMFPLAVGVVMQSVGPLADELARINERQWELRMLLAGLQNMQHFNGEKWVKYAIPASAERALEGFDPGSYVGNANPANRVSAKWKESVSAILENPDAEVVAPKVPRPVDYLPQA